MTRNLLELTIDVVAEHGIPTLEELERYEIETMRVRVHGPGGDNPCLTLGFASKGAGYGRTNAVRFLTEWYGSDEPESDLEVAIVTPAYGARA